jgi:hypothetical protein
MIVLFHVIPERSNPESEISRKSFISSELLARLTELNSTADSQTEVLWHPSLCKLVQDFSLLTQVITHTKI